ncbi:molecular chaperone [Klebsiella pneumoniae]|uniref:TorD/DmsD family molecular chaperone n=1 Tax=Klebsiella pneumoniae TaxID=573 RepID=UPI00190D3011|nr:molecular chaperone [Klebsiella pneumoniae]
MNEFSILCRVLGSLYYRQPQDPLLVPLFTLIREGKLAASWPLEQDELLARLQKSCEMQSLATDYNALFVGEAYSVPPYRSAWVEGSSEAEVRAFLSEHGIPTGEGPADHLGSLLLAASWLEDHAAEDQSETLELLFADYILPWCGTMLGKVEAHAHTPFWRTMAPLTRDAIAAMWDELQEEDEQ